MIQNRQQTLYNQAIYLRNNSAAPNPSSTTFEKKRIQNTIPFSSGNIQTRNTEIYDIYCPLSMYPSLCSVPLRCQNQFVFTVPAEDLLHSIFYRFLAQFVLVIILMVI